MPLPQVGDRVSRNTDADKFTGIIVLVDDADACCVRESAIPATVPPGAESGEWIANLDPAAYRIVPIAALVCGLHGWKWIVTQSSSA